MYCRLKNIRTVYIVVLYSNIVSSLNFVLLCIFCHVLFFCPVHIFVLFIFSSCIPVLHEQTLYQIYAVRKSSRTNWKLYTRGKPLIYGAWLSCTYFLVYIFCLIIFPSSTYFRPVHIIVLYKYYRHV